MNVFAWVSEGRISMRTQAEESVERCQEMENVSVNMPVFGRGFEDQQKASGVNDEE